MLTPQEVAEHAFAKASFGGYNMAMVDEFLDLLTVDYTTLYKENSTLKSKLKVLAEKVEEYRTTEDAMRKTLLTAQKMADDLVSEAEGKKAILLEKAEEEVRAQVNQIRQEIENERHRLGSAQKSVAEYVSRLKELYQHEMDYLNRLSGLEAPCISATDPVNSAARDIESTVMRMVENAPTESAEELVAASVSGKGSAGLREESAAEELEPEPSRRSPEDQSPTRRLDFDNLQFGKDFEIS